MTDATTVIISMEDRLKLAELTGELAKLEANLWIYVLAGVVFGLLVGFLLGIFLYMVLEEGYDLYQHRALRMAPIALIVLSMAVGAVIAVYARSAEIQGVEAQIEMIKQIWGLT